MCKIEQRARDNWAIKMCRCFGNFLILNYHLDPEIRKQKLIDFVEVPKRYVEVSKLYGKHEKELIKKEKIK